jgi:hypothetical protein
MFANTKPCLILILSLACCLVAGCGGSANVGGTVTLNGEMVDGGVITFHPADQPTAADKGNARINGGKYSISSPELTPGNYLVRISWQKSTGKKVDAPGDPGVKMDQTQQVVPKQYNSESNLTREIKSGSNTLNFELTGQPTSQPGVATPPPTRRIKD